MKLIFVFIFGAAVFSAPFQSGAQMIDDLFEEDDFKSSEIENMQKAEAERQEKAKGNTPVVRAAEPPIQSRPVVIAPSPVQVRPEPVIETVQPAKREVFSLSTEKPQKMELSVSPKIETNKGNVLPSLGSKAGKREDENLSLFEMRARKKGKTNVNTANFDIAGISLKMTPREVTEKALAAGFTVKGENHKIPLLKEWRYNRLCMQQMLFTHKGKKACVRDIAQHDNSEYVNRLLFENKKSRETIEVDFVGNLTGNQAYRVRYVSKGDHSLGTTDEARYQKSKRRREFIRLLIKKYGMPDDEQALLWGVSGVDTTLQAEVKNSFGDVSLVLEDLTIENDDFDKLTAQGKEEKSLEKFSF